MELALPKHCQLYCVSRDVLFSGNVNVEKLLINAEELQRIADSPDCQIFVLLPPSQRCCRKIPPGVLCTIIVHIESNLPSDIQRSALSVIRPVPRCFNKWNVKTKVSQLRGLHIIYIATNPMCKKMGYGLQAVQQLEELYEGKVISLEEDVKLSNSIQQNVQSLDESSKPDSPLLLQLSDLKFDKIDFMCVFFNLSSDVFSFWKTAEFVPLYFAPDKNSDAISAAMFKPINEESTSFVKENIISFNSYYFVALQTECRVLPATFALNIVNSYQRYVDTEDLSIEILECFLKPCHMKLLEAYCKRLHDLFTVIHIVHIIAKMYFKNFLKSVHLLPTQEAILLAHGLQCKHIDVISKDLGLPSTQVVGLLNRTLKKINKYITSLIEKSVESTITSTDVGMKPLEKDLNEELEEAAMEVTKQQEKLLALDVAQYAIKGSDDEWQRALFSGRKTLVSIKSIKNKVGNEKSAGTESENKFRKHNKQFKRKRH